MTTPFQIWLKSADEDGRREASAYRHHFPVERKVYVYDYSFVSVDPKEESYIKVVCGCDPNFAYTYGEGEHR